METWGEAVEHADLKALGELYIFQIYNFIMCGVWFEFLSSTLSIGFRPCAPLEQRLKNGANKWKCGGKCHNIYQGLLHSHISAAHKLDYIWEINDLDSASFWLKSFFRNAEAFFRKYVCQANHLMKDIRNKWLTFHQKIVRTNQSRNLIFSQEIGWFKCTHLQLLQAAQIISHRTSK